MSKLIYPETFHITEGEKKRIRSIITYWKNNLGRNTQDTVDNLSQGECVREVITTLDEANQTEVVVLLKRGKTLEDFSNEFADKICAYFNVDYEEKEFMNVIYQPGMKLTADVVYVSL